MSLSILRFGKRKIIEKIDINIYIVSVYDDDCLAFQSYFQSRTATALNNPLFCSPPLSNRGHTHSFSLSQFYDFSFLLCFFLLSLSLPYTHSRNGSVISSLTLFHRGYNFAFTFPRIRLVSLYNVSFLNKVANGRSGFSAESKSII